MFIPQIKIKKFYRSKKSRLANVAYHRWYWYRGIPFVIIEVKNPEIEQLKAMKMSLPSLWSMYNENGNWFVLEHPLYWFFNIRVGEYKDWCFEDSMHIWNEHQTEDEKWQALIDRAHIDIDNLYNYPWKICSGLIQRMKKSLKITDEKSSK